MSKIKMMTETGMMKSGNHSHGTLAAFGCVESISRNTGSIWLRAVALSAAHFFKCADSPLNSVEVNLFMFTHKFKGECEDKRALHRQRHHHQLSGALYLS